MLGGRGLEWVAMSMPRTLLLEDTKAWASRPDGGRADEEQECRWNKAARGSGHNRGVLSPPTMHLPSVWFSTGMKQDWEQWNQGKDR